MRARRVKVVFLAGGLELGGCERQLYLFLNHINQELFESHVIVLNPNQNYFKEDLEKIGIQVWPVPTACKGVLRRLRFLYGMLRKLRPDIIHSWIFYANPYAGVVGWVAGVPVRLGSERTGFSSIYMRSLPFVHRVLSLYSVSRIVVNSEATLREMVAWGYSPARIAVVQNCIDNAFLDSTISGPLDLSALGIQSSHRIVATVGNLRSQKNHLLFVKAMAMVLPRFPDVRALIVSQPVSDELDLRTQIESLIKKLNLENKIALVSVRPVTPAFIRRLAVFCLTSDYEGMPNVILEAMAAARPVVATRVGGVPDLIEQGVNGFMVDPGDTEGVAKAVENLLADPELAEKMGRTGHERIARGFSCEQTAQRLMNLYLDALGQK
jgi:glycosyltransferase involved in cell wall biosynthesis